MQISLEQAVNGFIGYMADQVATIPKAFDKWLGFGALAAVKRNPTTLLAKISPWLEMSGILADGKVDTDALRVALEDGFAHVPTLTYFGFTFNSADIVPLLGKMHGPEGV